MILLGVAVNVGAVIATGGMGLVAHLRGEYLWAMVLSFLCGANMVAAARAIYLLTRGMR